MNNVQNKACAHSFNGWTQEDTPKRTKEQKACENNGTFGAHKQAGQTDKVSYYACPAKPLHSYVYNAQL